MKFIKAAETRQAILDYLNACGDDNTVGVSKALGIQRDHAGRTMINDDACGRSC
jgi:hypothetical protein